MCWANIDFDRQRTCQSHASHYENIKCSLGHHGQLAPGSFPKNHDTSVIRNECSSLSKKQQIERINKKPLQRDDVFTSSGTFAAPAAFKRSEPMQPQGQCLLKMGLHNTYNENIATKKRRTDMFWTQLDPDSFLEYSAGVPQWSVRTNVSFSHSHLPTRPKATSRISSKETSIP